MSFIRVEINFHQAYRDFVHSFLFPVGSPLQHTHARAHALTSTRDIIITHPRRPVTIRVRALGFRTPLPWCNHTARSRINDQHDIPSSLIKFWREHILFYRTTQYYSNVYFVSGHAHFQSIYLSQYIYITHFDYSKYITISLYTWLSFRKY